MLNATWLETFTVLAEEAHFTRAAFRLNMTQPGVSQHLRKLEQQVGQRLIDQDGKRFTLTAAGERLRALGQARRAEEKALRDALGPDDADAGEVRIACSGSFALLFYPQAIALMQAHPRLCLHLEAAPQARILAGLLDQQVDLGVISHDPKHPRLAARQIGREELCLLLPAQSGPRPDLAALDRLGLVAHPDVQTYADAVLGANFPDTYRGAHHLRVRSAVNQIGQIPAPVAKGAGYTLLPRSGLAAFAQADQITVATLPRPQYQDLWLITRRHQTRTARRDRIADSIAALATRLD